MSKGKAGQPPAEHRFKKGQSGNPSGRPRKPAAGPASAFDLVIDRTLTVMQGGVAREVSVEEALQHKTYQDALAGNRPARREILKMIAKREKWLADKRPPKPNGGVEVKIEAFDPVNHNEAMLLLGIAERVAPRGDRNPHEHFHLQTWAVQAALSRPGRRQWSERDEFEIKRCTRDADTLRWPGRLR